jgi:hypothetical protein
MNKVRFVELSPGKPHGLDAIRTQVIEYWIAVEQCDDPGGTTWDVLEDYKNRVTECLYRGIPEDIREASRLTAEFEWHRCGGGTF